MQSLFGRTHDGVPVSRYTLRNSRGVEVTLMDYGAAITSLKTPDRQGQVEEITLGFDTLEPYLDGVPYFGAIVGRYGNRIARGRFTLDGSTHVLATNNGPNHLHGGQRGFDKRVWRGEPFSTAAGAGVRFTYVSADGEEGYPGAVTADATYQLGDDNTLAVSFAATTTRATPLNLTNHAYFNLSGNVRSDILGHTLRIDADRFTPVDATLIPNGELRSVADTPFDFRTPVVIGARIGASDEQLKNGLGYDHNWVLNPSGAGTLFEAAELADPHSGRVLIIRTTEPGLQFYSGNLLDGSLTSRGVKYGYRCAVALETQHFPDSPNQPAFPSTILRPSHTYRSMTTFTFAVR